MGVWVLGAGGHASVVLSTLLAEGTQVEGVLDDSREVWGEKILSVPVRGAIDMLDGENNPRVVIAIGNPHVRQKIARRWDEHVTWVSAVHPEAYVHESVTVNDGSVVFAGAVIQVNAAIGSHSIVNTSASIDHDSQVGDFAHVAPGAHLAGHVTVETGAHVGLGASVVQQCTIGGWARVGAGAVVVDDVPAQTTVAGVPARQLSSAE